MFMRWGAGEGAGWCSPLHGISVPAGRPRPGSLQQQLGAALSFSPPKPAGSARGTEPRRGCRVSLQQWEEEEKELSSPGVRLNPGFPTELFWAVGAGAGAWGAAWGAGRSGTNPCAGHRRAICGAGTCLVLHVNGVKKEP